MATKKAAAKPKKRKVATQPAVVGAGTAGGVGGLVALVPAQYQWIAAIAGTALSYAVPYLMARTQAGQRATD